MEATSFCCHAELVYALQNIASPVRLASVSVQQEWLQIKKIRFVNEADFLFIPSVLR